MACLDSKLDKTKSLNNEIKNLKEDSNSLTDEIEQLEKANEQALATQALTMGATKAAETAHVASEMQKNTSKRQTCLSCNYSLLKYFFHHIQW